MRQSALQRRAIKNKSKLPVRLPAERRGQFAPAFFIVAAKAVYGKRPGAGSAVYCAVGVMVKIKRCAWRAPA